MIPILFHVGPITLHTYGLLIAIGFLGALRVARGQFDRFGLPLHLLDRLVFYLMVFGLLGARLVYFGVDHFAELRGDPFQFFRIWEGGLVLYGAVAAGLIVLAVFASVHDMAFLSLSDAMAAPLLLGQSIGRLGCLAAGCCYGKPTDFFLHVTYTHPDSLAPLYVPLHPTQIYEAVGDLVLFCTTLFLSRRIKAQGQLTSFYLLGYGFFRFLMEFLRGDDRGFFIGRFSPSQVIALLMIASGTALLVYVQKRKTN